MSSRQTRIIRRSIVTIYRIYRENTVCDILKMDRPGIDGKCSEYVFPQLTNTVHGSNLYFVDQITHEMEIGQRVLDQIEHSFLQRLNGRGSSTYSSIALLDLCPYLDLSICQSPSNTSPNEQVHQVCRVDPVSGRYSRSSACWDYST
jgi:hypothetical protein